jgi:hypothetical protein
MKRDRVLPYHDVEEQKGGDGDGYADKWRIGGSKQADGSVTIHTYTSPNSETRRIRAAIVPGSCMLTPGQHPASQWWRETTQCGSILYAAGIVIGGAGLVVLRVPWMPARQGS